MYKRQIDDLNGHRIAILRALTVLRQMSLDPSLVDESYAGLAASAKVDALVEQLTELGIGQSFFIAKTLETVKAADFFSGMLKTIVFAFFIAITSCWRGFNTEGGTEGVGNSTTYVVVSSSIFILVSDFFLTKLFILTLYGGN